MKSTLDEESLSDRSSRWNNLGPPINVQDILNIIFNSDSKVEEDYVDNLSYDTTSPTRTTQRKDSTTLDDPNLKEWSDHNRNVQIEDDGSPPSDDQIPIGTTQRNDSTTLYSPNIDDWFDDHDQRIQMISNGANDYPLENFLPKPLPILQPSPIHNMASESIQTYKREEVDNNTMLFHSSENQGRSYQEQPCEPLSQISEIQDADKLFSSQKLPRSKVILSKHPRIDENMTQVQQVSQFESRSYSHWQVQNPFVELTAGAEDTADEQVQFNDDHLVGDDDSSSDNSALTNDNMISIIPTDEDVLCGRGGHTNTHPGNQELRNAAISLKPYYHSASNRPGEKRIYCKQLVAIIHNRGGRFLRKDDIGDWYVISNKASEEKCSQLFREGSDAEKHALRQKGIQWRRNEQK